MVRDELLSSAAERFGTPCYVYDLDALTAQAETLRAALGKRFTLAYAVKANPSLAVLATLSRLGLSADVASRGELAAAVAAGFPGERILATGPSKTNADLRALAGACVSQIHAEGPEELERLDALGRELGRKIPVGLRLNPPWGIAETRTIIGGPGAKKFGFDLPSARKALKDRSRYRFLSVTGFQVFNASNVLDARLLVSNVRRVLELAVSLSAAFDVPLRTVDFGGGFGVPYADGEEPLDLEVLSSGLAKVVAWAETKPALRKTRLVFEPGRFLVAEAGAYVTRVVGTKKSRGVTYVLVDGGVHHFLRPALLGTPHRARIVGRPTDEGASHVVVAGPLCTSLDVLHAGARLPRPVAGDLVAFENAGAYGFTESMPLFLSHEWPAEVGARGGRLALLRRAPTVRQLLAAQRKF